jgi:hypothetical protein
MNGAIQMPWISRDVIKTAKYAPITTKIKMASSGISSYWQNRVTPSTRIGSRTLDASIFDDFESPPQQWPTETQDDSPPGKRHATKKPVSRVEGEDCINGWHYERSQDQQEQSQPEDPNDRPKD